jgi:hypothetical protein
VNPDERLIIFAQARSGSSSLREALMLHPRLVILAEPFHPNHVLWRSEHRDYRRRITDTASLDSVLAEIFAEFDGLKTLAHELPTDLTEHMLLAPKRKVVFVRRRNILKAVVSSLVAQQSGLWQRRDATKGVLAYYQRLRPLSVSQTRAEVEQTRQMLGHYGQLLSRLPEGSCLEVVYEDLFLTPPAEREARFDAVLAFLQLEAVSTRKVQRFLDPARAQLNSEETYALVPNLRELDDALGNDETGRLFVDDR